MDIYNLEKINVEEKKTSLSIYIYIYFTIRKHLIHMKVKTSLLWVYMTSTIDFVIKYKPHYMY